MDRVAFRCLSNPHFRPFVSTTSRSSKRIATDSEYLDIAFGLDAAQQLAEENEGQTVVVRNSQIIAQDGVNGTDQTIRLALRKQAGGVVVCKVARSKQIVVSIFRL